MRRVPVLWVSGAPGVGKSTAGWDLYGRLGSAGRSVAYVDVDQLGLFAPDPPHDPGRHRLQAANAVEVLVNFARHGAEQLIVSGVIDPQRGIDPYVRQASDLEVTLVRLRADRSELRRRYLDRGSGVEQLDELMVVADAYDQLNEGVTVDVTALTREQVLDALLEIHDGTAQSTSADGPIARIRPAALAEGGSVLVISGPTAVGKSTVGWNVFSALCERGLVSAYIDIEQLGFASSGPWWQLKGDNLLSVWSGYRAAGAQCLVVVARGASDVYDDWLHADSVTRVHLDAKPGQLAKRVAQRIRGGGPRLAGDSLVGQPRALQRGIASRAAEEAVELRRHVASGHTVIDTSDHDPETVTRTILGLLEPTLRAN